MNIKSDIHNIDYRSRFEGKRLDLSTYVLPGKRKRESLDGEWNFTADALEYLLRGDWYREVSRNADGSERPADYDFDSSGKIAVPSCWNMQDKELFHYNGMGVYTRNFSYEPESEGERVFLSFEGVSYRAYVFLNGEYLGFHDGASTSFSVELTGHIRKENRLIVAADAARSDERVPMTNTDWFNYGGIYRDVYLIRTPEEFIRRWHVCLAPDSGCSSISYEVHTEGADGPVLVEIPGLGIRFEGMAESGTCRGRGVASPELWSPESPKLYDVVIRYGCDTVHDRIGFRDFRTEGNHILLNGKERFLRGICVHEDHPVLGKTASDECIRETIRLVKEELHGDFLRLTHYPHTPRFAEIADEMGILLWEEIPVYWAIDFSSDRVYRDAENQLSELIARDINRASAVIWSVGNENPDTDERLSFMIRLADRARELDPSRPVSAACLIDEEKEIINDRLSGHLDIIGINEYYGWYSDGAEKLVRVMASSSKDKPVIVTETGAGALSGHHGNASEFWTEEKQAAYYEAQVKAFRKAEGLSGVTPWILYDFRSERRMNRYQKGYNRKGLVDSGRKHRKAAFAVLAGFYKEIEG